MEYLSRAESLKEFLSTGKEVDEKQTKRRKLDDQIASHSAAADKDSLSVVAKLNPDLLAQVKGAILTGATGVSMSDVVGLDGIKKELDETISIPMMFPLAMADRGMNNAVLLYGVSYFCYSFSFRSIIIFISSRQEPARPVWLRLTQQPLAQPSSTFVDPISVQSIMETVKF